MSSLPRVIGTAFVVSGLVVSGLIVVASSGAANTANPPPRRTGAPAPGFTVACGFSHTAAVDPIVMPGMAGMSHRHEFFGNTTTDEDSSGASLLAGASTCIDRRDRSAYWIPSLLVDGERLAPRTAVVTYARGGPGKVTAFPVGFMAVSGRSDQTAGWACVSPGTRPRFTAHVSEIATCTGGSHLMAQIRFGQCWDGTSLDSSDHKSHLVFGTHETRAAGRPGRLVCPGDHPVRVAQLKLDVHYPAGIASDSNVTLSSGDVSTLHGDIFEAWTGTSLQERLDGHRA